MLRKIFPLVCICVHVWDEEKLRNDKKKTLKGKLKKYIFSFRLQNAKNALIVDSIKRELIKVSCLLHARLNNSQGNIMYGRVVAEKIKNLVCTRAPYTVLERHPFFFSVFKMYIFEWGDWSRM